MLLSLILMLGNARSQCQSPDGMNFLFIAVDDLKPLLGCYGDALAVTPHIDAVAGRGVTFTRNYCQQAVCAPSRTSLLTGRYPDQTRVWDLETMMREMDPGIITLPQYLKQHGYFTAGTGKIFDYRSVDDGHDTPSWSVPFGRHWNPEYYNPGTGKPAYYYASPHAKDTIALLRQEAMDLGVDELEYVRERYFPATENAVVPMDAYVDGAIARVGMELLDEAAATGDPFFVAVGFNRPHLPFNAPAPFWDRFQRDSLPLSAFQEQAAGSPSLAYHNSGELRNYTGIPDGNPLPEALQRELVHGYYAATSYIDSLIGLLVERLDELGLKEHTAIVIWGDHGWHLGDHQLWCKHTNFEEATRSPLVISYPGQPHPGARTGALTEFTDIAPTICELAGLEIPAYFEGESLGALFQDTLASLRDGSLSQYPRNGKMGYSLRTERYRYTRWTDPDGSKSAAELYDYQDDPLETVNLAGQNGYLEMAAVMDSMILERIREPSTGTRVLFRVSGSAPGEDTLLIADASIFLAGETKRTDGNGITLFTHHTGSFDFTVTAPGFIPLEGSMELRNDTVINMVLSREEPLFSVGFRITDLHSGKGILGATLLIGELEERTDFEGWIEMDLAEGDFPVRVTKNGYAPFTGTVSVSGDTLFIIWLEATAADVRIRLHEGETPVNLASVTLGERQVISNGIGESLFPDVPTGIAHHYAAQKEGYRLLEGTLVTRSDTTLLLQMEKWTGLDPSSGAQRIHVWPNPAENSIWILLDDATFQGRIQIMNTAGKVLVDRDTAGPDESVDIQSLPDGVYQIRCTGGTGTYRASFIKIR